MIHDERSIDAISVRRSGQRSLDMVPTHSRRQNSANRTGISKMLSGKGSLKAYMICVQNPVMAMTKMVKLKTVPF